MSDSTIECAVMFADVAGSTRLYEMLGDSKAQDAIGRYVSRMGEIASQYNGVVIKTIGDEIMCRFPSAGNGVGAACAIQEVVEGERLVPGVPISVRIGLHFGPAILENDDIFGDAVNVAARMAGIAKARQIITTEETVRGLPQQLAEMARLFDRTTVKGKQEELAIYEVVWEADDVTRMVGMATTAPSVTNELMLHYHGQDIHLTEALCPCSIGRGAQSDLVVGAPLASRHHAKIEYRRGKFVLIDQSTNGTYVSSQDGRMIYLRREELPLSGTGIISLGEPVKGDSMELIRYDLRKN